MRITHLFATTVLLLPVASASADDEVQTGIAPAGNWVVDFAPNKCRMFRNFGEGEDRHYIAFEQYWPSERFGLTVAGPSFKRWRSLSKTSLSFNDAQEPFETEPLKGESPAVGAAMVYTSVSLSSGIEFDEGEPSDPIESLDPELGDTVEYLHLRQRGKDFRLNTGPLGAAFTVLNQCTDDLLKDWGLDVEKHKTWTRSVEFLNEDKVVKRIANAYPTAALMSGKQAIFRLRLMIDETGAVTDCILNETTAANRLNSPACKEMRRAKFNPALDASGKPFASFYVTSITYRIRS